MEYILRADTSAVNESVSLELIYTQTSKNSVLEPLKV